MARNLVTGESIRGRCLYSGAIQEETIRLRPANQARRVYELHTDDDGHITVECHCARCEAEREESGYMDYASRLTNTKG